MRIHLAGQHPGHKEELLLAKAGDDAPRMRSAVVGHPYRLASYYYLKKLPPDTVKAYLADMTVEDRGLIIDSGLFSLMFGADKGALPETFEAYEEYTKEYLKTVDEWGGDYTFVEADTHRLLGMEATHKLRKLFEPYGDRVIYVWHQPEGLDGLEKLALSKDYIALSIPELRMLASGNGQVQGQSAKVARMTNDLLRRVHNVCKRNGVKPPRIHLLGCTVTSMMETRLAYSCDSTSWLSGARFGTGIVWSPGSERPLQSVSIRSEMFKHWVARCRERYPVAAKLADESSTNTMYMEIAFACAAAYTEYQTWLDAQYTVVPMRGA